MKFKTEKTPDKTPDKLAAKHLHTYSLQYCAKCRFKMVKRQNRKTKSWFWGCSQYPKCRSTVNIDPKTSNQEILVTDPSVSKHLEEPMLKKFEINRWYIVSKPELVSKPANAKGGSIMWRSAMDQYDGKPVRINSLASNDSRIAWAEECHAFAWHIDWAEGPFNSKEAALRSQIKVVATREPDIEQDIIEFENGLIEFYDRSVIEKVEADEVHLKDPESGVISVVQKSEIKAKMSLADKAAAKSYEKWIDFGLGGEARRGAKGQDSDRHDGLGNEISVDAPSAEEFEKLKSLVMTRFEVLEAQKEDSEKRKAFVDKVDTSKKCKKDIDKLFRDFHDRNKRREELTKRIDSELSKSRETPKRNWKGPVILAGCVTAISGSAYVLYPYMLAMLAIL